MSPRPIAVKAARRTSKTVRGVRLAGRLYSDPHVVAGLRYAQAVVKGEIDACKWIRAACKRTLAQHERTRTDPAWSYEFDERLAGRVCRFVEMFPHVKGPKANAGELLALEPWQAWILTSVYGFVHRVKRTRMVRRAYLEVPRGNGKTALAAPLGVYMAGADGEQGAECVSGATTRDQARIAFDSAANMLRRASAIVDRLGLDVGAHAIVHTETGSKFWPISAEAGNLDGLNLHFGLIEELHAHRTRAVYDVLETATAKRLASLLWIITTSGTDVAGICYEIRSYACKVLDGFEDDSQFAAIYTIDDEDLDEALTSERVWRKANPNFGVSVMPDVFAQLARKAQQVPSARNNFLTKHLDVWCSADSSLIDLAAYDRCVDPNLLIDSFEREPCWIGLDLASKVDLAAKVRLFKRRLPHRDAERARKGECESHYYFFLTAYLPQAAVDEGRNSQYAGWAHEERLITTPGEVLDFETVWADLLADQSRFDLRALAYDPFQAAYLVQRAQAVGIPAVEMRQTVLNFSEPTKALDALIRDGLAHFEPDPVMRWNFSNVCAQWDKRECVFPVKQRPEYKIDGFFAAAMALARANAPDAKPANPYAGRGIRFL